MKTIIIVLWVVLSILTLKKSDKKNNYFVVTVTSILVGVVWILAENGSLMSVLAIAFIVGGVLTLSYLRNDVGGLSLVTLSRTRKKIAKNNWSRLMIEDYCIAVEKNVWKVWRWSVIALCVAITIFTYQTMLGQEDLGKLVFSWIFVGGLDVLILVLNVRDLKKWIDSL